jgi:hypothetical protein
LAGTAGGVFIFRVALLSIARSIRKVHHHQTSMVVDFMAISAYGVALLAIAVQSPIIHTPYPPFGISASSFMTLASYLFSLGFYFSAVSVSQDEKLRRSIRKFVMKESNLLDSIGTAQMEKDIEKTVLKIAKEEQEVLTEQTGVEPSLAEDELREYLEDVLLEVKEMRGKEREG